LWQIGRGDVDIDDDCIDVDCNCIALHICISELCYIISIFHSFFCIVLLYMKKKQVVNDDHGPIVYRLFLKINFD